MLQKKNNNNNFIMQAFHIDAVIIIFIPGQHIYNFQIRSLKFNFNF